MGEGEVAVNRMIPNHEKSLPSRIRELELERSRAVVRNDWTLASEIAGQIAELKAKLQVALKPNTRRMTEEEIAAGETRIRDRRRWWTSARSIA